MAGFNPVGSTPVASILGSTASGVNYQLTAAHLRFVGVMPTVGIVMPAPRVTWFGAEVLHPGVSAARVTTIAVELLRSVLTVPTLAVMTTMAVEALHTGASAARATWIGVEALHTGSAAARMTWIGAEVLRSLADAPTSSAHGFVSIIW